MVQRPPTPVPADGAPGVLQRPGECRTGERRVLIGIEALRPTVCPPRRRQAIDATIRPRVCDTRQAQTRCASPSRIATR